MKAETRAWLHQLDKLCRELSGQPTEKAVIALAHESIEPTGRHDVKQICADLHFRPRSDTEFGAEVELFVFSFSVLAASAEESC